VSRMNRAKAWNRAKRVALCRVTARRTEDGLKTVKRELIGITGDDPEEYLDRAAEILSACIDLMQTKNYLTKQEEGGDLS